MPIGEGKYNLLCSMVLTMTDADAAVVIIANGVAGSGFAMQATPEFKHEEMIYALERVIEEMKAELPTIKATQEAIKKRAH